MKNLSFVFLLIILFAGCQQNSGTKAVLNGNLQGVTTDTLEISYHQHDYLEDPVIRRVQPDDNGHFSVSLPVEEIRRFTVRLNPKNSITVMLMPGWNTTVHAELSPEQSLDTSYFEGEGATENNIYSKVRSMSFKAYDHLKDQPVDFIHFLDSLQGEMKTMVATAGEELDEKFRTMLDADIKYSTLSRWNTYKRYAGRFKHDLDQPVVNQFDDRVKSAISMNDEPALASSFYKSFLEDTLMKFARNQIDIQALREKHASREELSQAYMEDLFTHVFEAIDSLIENPDIKAHSYYHIMLRNMRIDRLDQLRNMYNERFRSIVSQEDQLQVIEDKLAGLEKMTPGNPAPGFAYPDQDGEMVSLDDLKGRYVYLDIWATWCGPCLAQIPKMKELHEKYGDRIAFVSVSVDPDKNKWMSFLEEKELEGYQLYSGKNFESQIIKDYMIQGIPRFVMINPEGNIVDIDAPRPTSEKTEEMMKEWMEQGGSV